jgi:hypothetical protein
MPNGVSEAAAYPLQPAKAAAAATSADVNTQSCVLSTRAFVNTEAMSNFSNLTPLMNQQCRKPSTKQQTRPACKLQSKHE